MQKIENNIKVIHFQRKPRFGFNYSIERFFENLRSRLKNKIDFAVEISGRFNDGYFSKIHNIIEAAFRQKKNAISHITGEIYFIDLLMRKRNTLLTIHDCRFMERKKGIEKKLMGWIYLKLPVQRSNYIVSISETTKRDIIKYTHCSAEKIKVIPVAVDEMYQPVYKSFNIDNPVILQVGTAPNKNIARLAAALQGIKCALNIIGKLSGEQLQVLKQNKIDYTNHYNLSLAEMFEQYCSCDMLVFVSTFEGFGMPIIEANCVERVILTSNISSMPEIAGNAAHLVDPYNVEEIRNGMLKLIQDETYREQLIENGRKNKLRFNPAIIAKQYYQLYKEMAGKIS